MTDIRPAVGDSSWFVEARLGMFIHWGLYALPARHEWVKHHERITDEDYQKYFQCNCSAIEIADLSESYKPGTIQIWSPFLH